MFLANLLMMAINILYNRTPFCELTSSEVTRGNLNWSWSKAKPRTRWSAAHKWLLNVCVLGPWTLSKRNDFGNQHLAANMVPVELPTGMTCRRKMTDISQLKTLPIIQTYFKHIQIVLKKLFCNIQTTYKKHPEIYLSEIWVYRCCEMTICMGGSVDEEPLALPGERSLISMGQAQRQLLPRHP